MQYETPFIGILVCVLVLLSACSPQQQNPDETETRSLPAVEEREEEKDVLPDSKSGSSRQDVSSGEEPEDVPQGVLSYPDTQAEDSTEPAVSPKPSEAPASSPQTQITSPAVPENHGSTPSPEAAPSPVPETQPTPEPEPMPEPTPNQTPNRRRRQRNLSSSPLTSVSGSAMRRVMGRVWDFAMTVQQRHVGTIPSLPAADHNIWNGIYGPGWSYMRATA